MVGPAARGASTPKTRAMWRLQVVLGHLSGRPDSGPAPQAARCLGVSPRASASDVVVVHGRRTAIGKAGRGGFKDTTPDELLAAVLTAVLQDVRLRPEQLGDICVGNVLQPGAGAVMARIAQFLSGIPETVPMCSINRQCSSGLQALANIAGGIRNGSYDIGMACGVESMSMAERGNPGNITSRLVENEKARDCLIPMGITSENVAERFGISREKQDAFALASQQNSPMRLCRQPARTPPRAVPPARPDSPTCRAASLPGPPYVLCRQPSWTPPRAVPPARPGSPKCCAASPPGLPHVLCRQPARAPPTCCAASPPGLPHVLCRQPSPGSPTCCAASPLRFELWRAVPVCL